jgi:fatty acid desaturase
MIDAKYFKPDPAIYFRDFGASLALFILAFIWGAQTSWPLVILPWLLAITSLHRAGLFGHEVVHQRSAALRGFRRLVNWTIAIFVLVPLVRFQVPHLSHHKLGTFATPKDPQYPLVRSSKLAMTMVLVVIPFIVPLTNLVLLVSGAFGAFRMERAVDSWTTKAFGFSLSSELTPEQQTEAQRLSLATLIAFVAFVLIFPQHLPFLYAVQVGGWALVTARIPLEHSLEGFARTSTQQDQMLDSFTIETPLALLVQPVGFRFHTAHHMYPGVPYHHLPALHQELKDTVPGYKNSVISLLAAIKGPKRNPDLSPHTKR